jgi:hypothetical protein
MKTGWGPEKFFVCGFPQCLQKNVMIVPLIRQEPLLSHRLKFIDHSSTEYLCSLHY